jgi:leucyl aminopeptidase
MSHTLNVVRKSKASIPITVLAKKDYAAWHKKQTAFVKHWLEDNRFTAGVGKYCLLPGKSGKLAGVVAVIDDKPDLWSLAHLPGALPAHAYRLEGGFSEAQATHLALGWALAGYRFTRYKKNTDSSAQLVLPAGADGDYVTSMAQAILWARDLINIPANDMHPAALAAEAESWAKSAGGKINIVKGETLRTNYPLVHAVGKAGEVPPRLVDIRFARKGAPKIVLVGKGITFDSGGLDLKSSSNMRLMKKDMAGVALALALARVIVESKLDVDLRLMLPMAENAVGGNANRPLDIIRSRKGITVEIGNTDAEGRLVLCDALAAADEESPDLMVDFSTLTGAARVALGLDVAAFFTSDDRLADRVAVASRAEADPMWRLPLVKAYRKQLDTPNADLSNDPDSGYGGAITAALYLQEFVSKTPSWLHIDMMAWNASARPGRPQGGEVMAIRALYSLIKEHYAR